MFLDEKKEGGDGMNLKIRQILAEMPAFSAGMSPVSLVCLMSKTTY
jgi:hypothetical protein